MEREDSTEKCYVPDGPRSWPLCPGSCGAAAGRPVPRRGAQSSHHPLKVKYQDASSPPQTLRHQEHLLGHLLGNLGDSVPTVHAAILWERQVHLSVRPGWTARGAARGAAMLVL